MAGLLDYIANAMSGGQMSQAEKEAALYAKRADTLDMPTRGEATPADLMRVMSTMQDRTPAGVMKGATAGVGLNEVLNNPMTMPPTSGMGNMSEVEGARMKQLMMQNQMDKFSRQNAFMSNPQAVPYYQQTNPLGNTMQNISPQAGGMVAGNARPPMDLNSLIRMLSR
jgi:hypothetical protein